MTRGDKREHWREQTSEAMFMVGMFCFTGVLIAIAGYGLPPYAHGLLWGGGNAVLLPDGSECPRSLLYL